MASEVQRTIHLLKKAYDQPIIFHILHSHLVYLLSTTTPMYEITDEWSKLLIYSAHPNRISNQALELKIQALLKRIRPPLDTPESKLKLTIICYYLLNKPSSMINHMIIFDLFSNFLGYSEYFDGLIIKIGSNLLVAGAFRTDTNKKLGGAAANRMLQILQEKNLSLYNKIRALPCFINSNIKPFDLTQTIINQRFVDFKMLESFCLYAKYTKDTSFIKEVLPSDVGFIESLKNFMSLDFHFTASENIDLKRCLMEDRSIYDKIKQQYELAEDKCKFVADVIDFITSLK